VALARRGYEVVAIELGAGLAAVARRKLAFFPAVSVVTAAFETWPLPAEPFDLVLAATSFHWIDPDVRVAKSADALRPGGALAIVSTHHVAGGSEAFFVEVQGCYERWVPATPAGERLPAADDVARGGSELEPSGRFGEVSVHRYEHERSYSTPEYRDLLLTYSGHRALEPTAQRGLLACIARLMDDHHDGRITKRYLNQLAVAVLRAG
jgi:SAM-dependent methyltransferase